MSQAQGVNGIAVGVLGAGVLLLWSGLKGASVAATLQDLIKGKAPAGQNIKPISTESPFGTQPGQGGYNAGMTGTTGTGSAKASRILQVAASKKGQCYLFGGGHPGNPCTSRCTDCSSYVSCVLNQATGSKISMATGGLSGYGRGVPYAQRAPGDVIVWNGGTGGGHTGIIATVSGRGGTMWHNPCTKCGGVQLGKYPFAGRTAAAAVVRRV